MGYTTEARHPFLSYDKQSYRELILSPLSTLCWRAYLKEVLISARGRGCIFNSSAKEGRFISVRVMEGGRKSGNMAGDQLHSIRQWCLEESVAKRRQIRALSLCRARPATPEGDVWWHRQLSTTFPTWAAFGSPEDADLLYCLWCVTEQSWEGLWVIGSTHTPPPIPLTPRLKPITCLLYLSQQKTLRQRKIEPRLRFLISSSSCVRTVCGAHCCEKKRE